MDWIQAVWLALVQGVTEFLPVSSSAHLILMPKLFDWPDQGLAFDVAVHVGTLAAVLLYFRRSLRPLVADTLASMVQRRMQGEARLGWAVLVATLPLVLGGFLLSDAAETWLRAPEVIAWATIGFGLLLWVAARAGRGGSDEHGIGLGAALLIGCAQVLAIIPGTSRSGITMTAGLFLGLEATAAARFSFLLSIPAIGLAGAWKGLQLATAPQPADWGLITFGAALSGVAAYACIGAFLALLRRIGMTPFVLYRLALGGVLLVLL